MNADEPNSLAPLRSYTQVIYVLHAVSILTGLLGAATIVGSFIFGLPSIVAVIMNYARRSEVRGTWLDSHFSWQLRTFWFAALWILVIGIICTPLILLFGLGLILMWIGIAIVGLWILYRVIRGWLALKDGRAV